MAKFKPGIAVGQVSGSVAGNTFSHNRYGMYIRDRVVPVKVTSEAAINAKARLAHLSQAWQGLTAAQRLEWGVYAANNPITDVLGDKQVLTGHTAYQQINNLLYWMGSSVLSQPPVGAPPAALTSLSLTADIGAGDVAITFTPTPSTDGVLLWAAVTDGESQAYVANKLRLLTWFTAGQNSPRDIEGYITTRFGGLQVGQLLVVRVAAFDVVKGLRSMPLEARAVVTTT